MNFAIVDSPSTDYSVLVLLTTIDRPQDHLEDVQKVLRMRGVTGTVVFDLLACNASPTRRFFAVEFNGSDFGLMRFELLHDSTNRLNEASAFFIKENFDRFDFSLLNPSLRLRVEQGSLI